MSSYNEEPIAVIGMSCRFPGDARSVEDFWSFLLQGRSSVTPIPSDRFNADAHYHPSSARQGGIKVKKGHFLKEDVAAFDAPFFGMTKGEADATGKGISLS
jgi:acyl transferase domain-containing protein